MDISYHTEQIKNSINEYNVSLSSKFPNETEGQVEQNYSEKEYKMPFEMKVFQKRLKKHLFYRSQKNKPQQKEDVTQPFEEEPLPPLNNKVKWSSLPMLQQKRLIVQYIRGLAIHDDITQQRIIRQVWDAMSKRFLKTKHVKYNQEKKSIEQIQGLEERDGIWAFNVAKIF